MASPSTLSPKPSSTENKPSFGDTYVFRLRKHSDGPFRGLWEMSMLEPKGCEKVSVKKVLSDADALIFCLENLQGTLEADGL